jgi:gliding motility-associated-like protein
MVNYKPIIALQLFVLLYSCFPAMAQQAPIITPKPPLITLHLDAAGHYTTKIEDLATLSTSTNDSANRAILTPKKFDCSTTGQQLVHIKAINNGFKGNLNAQAVQLQYPIGLAFDRAGNLYVVQNEGNTIKKISPGGDVSVFAGTGEQGYVNGPKATALFDSMHDLVIDNADNIYVTDSHARIRKITPDGIVSTFAGKGVNGDGDDQGEKAIFNQPQCMAIDHDGNIYVGDNGNFKVRKVTPDGLVTTFAGDGREGNIIGNGKIARFGSIGGLAVDAENNVYVADNTYAQIKKITPDGTVSVYAGSGNKGTDDGDRLSANLLAPFSLVFDESGNLFFADLFTIRKITPNGKLSTVAGDNGQPVGNADGVGSEARFSICEGMKLDPCGNIYIADFDNQLVRKMTADYRVSTIAGDGPFFVYTGNVGASSCAASNLDIPVNVQSRPTITSVFGDIDVTDCANLANYTTKATATDNCPASTIRFTQTPDANTVLQNQVAVKVTLTATDNTGGSNSISFNVTAKNNTGPPPRSVTITAFPVSVCEGTPIAFTADVQNPDAGTSYQWLVNGINTGPNAARFTSSTLKTGDVVNCAVTTGGGCGIPNLGADVPVTVNPYPAITLNPAEQIIAGGTIRFNPTVTGNIATYRWTPTDGLSDPNAQYPVARPQNTTTYQLKVTSTDGCDNTGEVKVTVIHSINVPNSFSPNGDGQNDTWKINALDAYPQSVTQVFTRYGNPIFKSTGYTKPWDGRYGDKQIPAGTYYYVIDLKNGTILKGWVLVVR